MNKSFIGNEYAYSCLENYVNQASPGPLILLGKKGLGKIQAAQDVACHLLDCNPENLLKNPDFLLLDKKNESLKVEDALSLIDKSSMSAVSKRKVFIIRNTERMNVQAQNKLLKLLEDKNKTNIVILICNQDNLLETIKSRCNIISFLPHTYTEMKTYLLSSGLDSKEIPLLAHLCDFCPYNLPEVQEYYPSLKEIYEELIRLPNREALFQICHLLEEKDTKNFYEIHAEHYPQALLVFQYIFYHLLLLQANLPLENSLKEEFSQVSRCFSLKQSLQACTAIQDHQKQWQNSTYSKNDFFDLIRIFVDDEKFKWL